MTVILKKTDAISEYGIMKITQIVDLFGYAQSFTNSDKGKSVTFNAYY